MKTQNKEFELNGRQPAPLALLAFMVGDCDWVAAVDEAGARKVLEQMNGEEPGAYNDWDVERVSDEWLDKTWCEEDDRTKIAGTLREWLAAATEPAYLAGTE
ncbi:hypothetical protein POF45_26680 [Pseudomonas sp. 681]|uniref:Uncharacterized protein n=1 Tax=Pseudomonas fungipugnans TaxID=3024217 RepID=A0ABT6QVP8_9PSED|nr:hypothetical protein [Pseudomonas sp. 681]MDI2594982.1 hypothetical protein [Pseudomonas sp. 681]